MAQRRGNPDMSIAILNELSPLECAPTEEVDEPSVDVGTNSFEEVE
jgi:hypothetical protein